MVGIGNGVGGDDDGNFHVGRYSSVLAAMAIYKA